MQAGIFGLADFTAVHEVRAGPAVVGAGVDEETLEALETDCCITGHAMRVRSLALDAAVSGRVEIEPLETDKAAAGAVADFAALGTDLTASVFLVVADRALQAIQSAVAGQAVTGTVLASTAAIHSHFTDALQAVAAIYAGQTVISAGQTVPGKGVVAERTLVAVAAIGCAADHAANVAPFAEIRGVEEIA